MVALHATETPSIYLSAHARGDVTRDDLDRALVADRSLVRQLCMRRTMFVVPRETWPSVLAGPAARVAGAEERRTGKELVRGGLTDDPDAWLHEARAAVLAHLRAHPGSTTQEVRSAVPAAAAVVPAREGDRWSRDTPVGPWLLTMLGARGEIVRGDHAGHWRAPRHRWYAADDWLPGAVEALDEPTAYADLVRRWLGCFGPGTETDLVWWLGSTKTAVRRALADVGAVQVALDGPDPGWLLPDDLDPVDESEPWAALLPVLDPTAMGWKQRDWYLHPDHVPWLVDSNGNIGTTAWWCGRVVGCWVQEPDAEVRVVLREDVGGDGQAALATEAERLTGWMDGEVVSSVYASRQMRGERLP